MLEASVASQAVVVLVIDPDPGNQRAMRDQLLRLGYSARMADDYDSAQAIVASTPPDIVLVPGSSARPEGWLTLQEQLDNWGIPVLRLAEAGGPIAPGGAGPAGDAALRARDADLKGRVDAALRSRDMHKALIVENKRLAAERLHDPLTGLFNRRYLLIRIEEEVRRSTRHGYPLAVMLLDIDGFGKVNESWGHAAGDSVLRDMAHLVTRTLRSTDIIVRYRDDQFMALLTDTEAAGAQVAANRVRDAIAAHDFFNQLSSQPIKLTVSVGISYWQPSTKPGEGTWEPQLVGLAERALRAAKLSGQNRLVMLQAA